MNAKAALVKEFLDGKKITIMTCFKTIGLTNLGREVPRMIEDAFGVTISREKKEGTSRYGSNITWVEYKLDKSNPENKEGVAKMRAYLSEKMKDYRPKEKDITEPKPDLFTELLCQQK